MIEVTPSTAFMLYLAVTLSVLVIIWIRYHYRTKKQFSLPAETLLLVCEYCHCAYVEDHAKEVTQCPNCSSFNKNNRYRTGKKKTAKKKVTAKKKAAPKKKVTVSK